MSKMKKIRLCLEVQGLGQDDLGTPCPAGVCLTLGDEDAEIAPGTLFEKLPEDWVCPECAEGKDQFIEA